MVHEASHSPCHVPVGPDSGLRSRISPVREGSRPAATSPYTDAVHHAELIATIALALGGALVAGYATQRIGLSPILGYLLAGIAVGPHTPGFVADVGLASQLAEVGVVLLMFGVGLHFSLKELWEVRS